MVSRNSNEKPEKLIGQIRSGKALPILRELYKNDPEGETCNHKSELCQYEIHKAIVSIEHNWLVAKDKNLVQIVGISQ